MAEKEARQLKLEKASLKKDLRSCAIMKFDDQVRNCHAERREASRGSLRETLADHPPDGRAQAFHALSSG